MNVIKCVRPGYMKGYNYDTVPVYYLTASYRHDLDYG